MATIAIIHFALARIVRIIIGLTRLPLEFEHLKEGVSLSRTTFKLKPDRWFLG
jgi:hypothetical protein